MGAEIYLDRVDAQVRQENDQQNCRVKGSKAQVRRQRDYYGMKRQDRNPALVLDHPGRLEDEVTEQVRREYSDERGGHSWLDNLFRLSGRRQPFSVVWRETTFFGCPVVLNA